MYKLLSSHKILSFTLIIILIQSCATVPITGRRQLKMIPDETIQSTSAEQYKSFLAEHKISSDSRGIRLVKKVGTRIQHAVEMYLESEGLSHLLDGYDWEFSLIESKELNAWCMPGGKVVVYTKILKAAQNEGGLAVIIGHEIAHAIAEHGNERMSQILLAQMGGIALSTALAQRPQQTQQLWMDAFGMGASLGVLLPFSRTHESEADHIGLIFMSIAGYDPNYAIGFWERMAEMSENNAPDEFFSTHPSDERRIREIQKLIPSVMEYYEDSDKVTVRH